LYDVGDKKVSKLLSADKGILPELISWDNDDHYIYYGVGKFVNLNALMRVSVTGGDPEIVFDFKKAFPKEVVLRVVYDADTEHLGFELGKGKGSELWKISGLFE